MKTTEITLESTAQVLIRCFWMGKAFQVFWLSLFLAGGQWLYELNQWVSWSRHEFDLCNIYALVFLELLVYVGFLVPYFAIRMVLGQKPSNSPRGDPT